MRVRNTVQVQISLDADGKRKLFSDDQQLSQTMTDQFATQANSVLAIAPSNTENLSLGDVELVRGLYLEVDKEAKVRLNGSSDFIQMRMAPDGVKARLFLEAEITAITVENTSTDVLSGVYVCFGDPIAP